MQSNSVRIVVGIAVVAIAVVLFVVLNGGGGSDDSGDEATTAGGAGSGGKPAQPQVPTIVVDKSGEPVGGIAQISVDEGERVRFKVKSAIAEEVHVHGYDLMKDVEAGGTVSFDFPATIEGIFEAELEGRGEQILELTVNPS